MLYAISWFVVLGALAPWERRRGDAGPLPHPQIAA